MIGDIRIAAIPHKQHRYETCGDWYVDKSRLEIAIKVSQEMGDASCFLVALHELVEMKLCLLHGVTEQQVDDFDMNFKGEGEPGDDPAAPYHKEHVFATEIERRMADAMGVNWEEHEARINAL